MFGRKDGRYGRGLGSRERRRSGGREGTMGSRKTFRTLIERLTLIFHLALCWLRDCRCPKYSGDVPLGLFLYAVCVRWRWFTIYRRDLCVCANWELIRFRNSKNWI